MLPVAVIGLGYWGPNLARNLASGARTALAGVCDLDPGRVEAVVAQHPTARRYTAVEEVLADEAVQAVAIATPVSTHYAIAKAALLAGKHILVEKPFTSDSQQAEELIALAEQVNRVLLVDHVFLYSPAVRKLTELVRTGALGDMLYIDSVRINLGLFQQDVNVMWDLAPHDLSIIDSLVGRPPLSVVAVGARHAQAGAAVAYLHLDYGNDLLASVHVNWMSPVKLRHFMVGGTRRSALYNDLDPSERVKIYDRGVDFAEDPEGKRAALVSYRSGDVVSPRLDQSEPLRVLVDHLADCVAGRDTPLSGGAQGLRVVRILEAAEQSFASGGRRVELTS